MRYLAWFSCGAASAAAAKLALARRPDTQVVYCDTLGTEHPDNARFFADVQRWLGVPITVIKSGKYTSVDDVFLKRKYMSGPKGAPCTTEMKKIPREAFQRETDTHVFGYTADEVRRAETFEKNNPTLVVEWVLIDAGVTKEDCLKMLSDAGIALPQMYALGFDHNNCLGCVKSKSTGYWNRVRKLFPEVFERRVRQSRLIGTRLVEIAYNKLTQEVQERYTPGPNGRVRVFLDELPLDEAEPDDEIECGPVCQTPEAK